MKGWDNMMNGFKTNMVILAIWSLISLGLIFVLSMLIFFNVINAGKIDLFIFLTSIIVFVILGFLSGNIKNKSGLVNGVLLSTFVVLVLIIVSIFVSSISLQFSHIVRFIIMVLSSGLGGIIGVNFKPLVK